jgi:hypothetical protein
MGERLEPSPPPEGFDSESLTAAPTVSLAERLRHGDMGRTVVRHVDVAQAFHEEHPTTPAAEHHFGLAAVVDVSDEGVHVSIPLDSQPVLAVADTDVPWRDLGLLATELLLRIDGTKSTMAVVTGLSASPNDGVRALAHLVNLGLVRLERMP